ncbi:T9SS type A sorting domain-containing protein [Flavivirga jejuensis]|uniref:T9SS type A sorting domain-containing protein n=1 Tax=Flavivirga jejuensis TaxID=870487 RepID=A0ABT8WT94_9FLAO|nr:T9SS type A sorting domain-containing protein [Flavivirga jejuensis]MDO5976106.1 T9SS type A sorting domain-containing protein [Flavivirga jejuensis]
MKNLLFLLLLIISASLEAQIVNIPDVNFKNALINNICADTNGDGISDSDVDFNNDGEIQVSEAEAVFRLFHSNENITSLEGIASFTNLEALSNYSNNITSLNLNQNTKLKELRITGSDLPTLDLSQNVNLTILGLQNNQLTSIDVNQCTELKELFLSNNQLASLDVSQNQKLVNLQLRNNKLTSIDISQNPNLEIFLCSINLLTNIDINQNPSIISLACSANPLTSLFLKNGNSSSEMELLFDNTPTLEYICVDEDEQQVIQDLVDDYGYTNCVVHSYCSFVPGGNFYIVEGETTLDIDNNGCDVSDIMFPNLKLNITDGIVSGYFFSNELGRYSIHLQDGTHTITPILDNPSNYFNVSPLSITVDFPSDSSPSIQNFCLTPKGDFNDLEVVIIPFNDARPGFDAKYKLIYTNKGTTSLTGSLHFTFEDNVMNFVSANPVLDSQNLNTLIWNFSNILPFESREIYVSMNLNTPTDANFPLNGGDVLNFIASLSHSTNDETPNDNVFNFPQTVVNSFDPNDKTCIEGNTLTPDRAGEYLNYMIRFENTGTANAINVVVKDEIDPSMFDISTLKTVTSSHSMITRINNNNTVEFIFENINLPFDNDNNDGFVVFKIRTLDTLVLTNTIENDAEIYFDFNFPIMTNNEVTTIENVLSLADYDFDDVSLEIYPNPIINTITIKSEDAFNKISIYNVNGCLYKQISLLSNKTEIKVDLNKLNSGLYFIKVESLSKIYTRKFIKQ